VKWAGKKEYHRLSSILQRRAEEGAETGHSSTILDPAEPCSLVQQEVILFVSVEFETFNVGTN
jgi:hypothetical protein